MQLSLRNIDFIWLVLMGITIINSLIAETADTNLVISVIIAISVAFKGRMVVQHFMELHNANRFLRNMMNLYFYVIPLLIVIVQAFPAEIADITRLN
ncbi:MAG: cytochrome C oxidase subunit IV family protein [Chromatiales bacterium]|nr:cytochrome C oxidase subunit IV family protein [Chromatiales bacterium]